MTRERLEQIASKERGIPQAYEIRELIDEIERCWALVEQVLVPLEDLYAKNAILEEWRWLIGDIINEARALKEETRGDVST